VNAESLVGTEQRAVADEQLADFLEDDRIRLKTRCVAMLIECPTGKSRPCCPFSEARQKHIVDRVNWLKSLPTAALRDLLRRHCSCASQTAGVM
jgi:hypothetical protein